MSEIVLLAIVTGISGLLTTIATIIGSIFLAKLNRKQDTTLAQAETAAVKVAEVRQDLNTQHAHVDTKLNQLAHLAREGTAIAIEAQKTGVETLKVGQDTQKTGVDTHTLVNSNMGVQLKLNAAYARRIAEITHEQEDIRVADLAQTTYDEHMRKQAIVDEARR